MIYIYYSSMDYDSEILNGWFFGLFTIVLRDSCTLLFSHVSKSALILTGFQLEIHLTYHSKSEPLQKKTDSWNITQIMLGEPFTCANPETTCCLKTTVLKDLKGMSWTACHHWLLSWNTIDHWLMVSTPLKNISHLGWSDWDIGAKLST